MSHYVGLEISVKSVSNCVLDADGSVLVRGETTSDPDQIADFIETYVPKPEQVVHESRILAIWLTRELEKQGLPIICIDARLAHKALSGRINKTDPGDAEGLAQLARTGWYTEVHIRSEASERVRALIGTRERLIRMRKDLEAHVRGVLKVFGICMKSVGRCELDWGKIFGINWPRLARMILPTALWLRAMEEELKSIARDSDLARRLMTVPGVGPVVAMSFIATLDDVSRFQKSKDVGAFLGLTPQRHKSGEVDWSGRISKCGDRGLLRLLYSAATTLITQVKKPSALLSWATQLYERKGFKKAAVAAARKTAVTLHCIWRDNTVFEANRKILA